MNKSKKIGYLLAILGGLFWSISGVCGQFLFQQKSWTPEGLVPLRLLLAGIFLTIWSVTFKGKSTFDVFKIKKDVFSLIVFAVLGLAMCQYTYFKAISLSNAAITTAIQYCSPAVITLYLLLFKKKKLSVAEFFSVILAIIGVFVLSTHMDMSNFSISPKALTYALFSMVAVAIYTLQPASLLKTYGTVPVTGLGMIIGGVIMCIISPPIGKIGAIDLSSIAAFFTIILFGSMLSFTFFLEGVRRIGPAKGNILSSTEPIGSAVLCVIFMNVNFNLWDYIGMLLIISTVFVLYFGENKTSKRAK